MLLAPILIRLNSMMNGISCSITDLSTPMNAEVMN